MLSLEDLHAQIDEALAINSVESSFSYEYFTDIINEQRALWLRNEYNRNRTIDPYILQELPCLELELVDPIQCCVPHPTGCKVLRTKLEIPNTIEFFYSKGIASVGPADITKPRFTLIDYSRVPYVGNGRMSQNAIYAYIYGRHIYITSKNPAHLMMQRITIRGIFEDPTALSDFINCSSTSTCWKPSDPYPINQWMWAYIKPYILQQLMQKGVSVMDDANNTQDDKAAQVRMQAAQQQQQNGGQ